MGKRLKQLAVVFIVLLVAAQLVRPARTNPTIDPTRTIQTHTRAGSALAAVLDRSCGDCHSNATVWPWYSSVAPLSWLMAYAVKEGRGTVNFSEWANYPPERQQKLLAASCQAVSQGKMPGGAWTALHPETRLSAQDIDTICQAARP